VTNPGPVAETLHVLPTAWFRNTWSWDADAPKPVLVGAGGSAITIEHPLLGSLELLAGPGPDGVSPVPLFCENETNLNRLYGVPAATPYPKDGINDHVIGSAATVNPDQRGTKCAFWYRLTVAPGETAELRLRLAPAGATSSGPDRSADPLGDGFERVVSRRRAEADEFYAELTPAAASADEAMVMRQAFSRMLWSKQLYYFDVNRWLEGDPTHAGRAFNLDTLAIRAANSWRSAAVGSGRAGSVFSAVVRVSIRSPTADTALAMSVSAAPFIHPSPASRASTSSSVRV
jgi:hypothetical protein